MQGIKTHITWLVYCSFIIGAILTACKKLVQVDPPSTSINSGNVYDSDPTAIAAVTNMYVTLSGSELRTGGIASLNLFPSLSSDELSLYNGATNYSVNFYYKNALTSTNLASTDFWPPLYNMIYVSNAALEELSKTAKLTPAVKTQLIGETKFIRAFCYFYLVNLYGDVPLALSSDYVINSVLKRKPKNDVYTQIITDLKDAQGLLSTQYLNASLLSATSDRVRPTRWAATALLARVYLFDGKFAEAENEATTLINNSSLFNLPALNNVFLKNSSEAIWQLPPVIAGWNTQDAKTFILPSNGPDVFTYSFYLSNQLLGSFETNDQRKTIWTNKVTVGSNTYYYPYKYKSATYNNPVTEYKMMFRLAEQYLIRAEARAKQNKVAEGVEDLKAVRTRAGLNTTIFNDPTSLLNAILHERQMELFTEWGHRWFDLKRTGNVDAVMGVVTPLKGGTWSTNWQLYPIARTEILSNPNLVQNAGY